jgi:hypothetical protein
MASSSLNKREVYDPYRKAWVRATPEELVRQQWLHRMVNDLGYPKEFLVVEKQIRELPHLQQNEIPDRRIDILCYAKGEDQNLFPLLLVECKAESISDDAVNQVIGYNHHVQATSAAVVNASGARFWTFDRASGDFQFYSFLPLFKELIQWAHRQQIPSLSRKRLFSI